MNQNERKTVARRMILLIAVACVIMGLYVMRLIFLQLVNGDPRRYRGQRRAAHCHHNHQLQCGP